VSQILANPSADGSYGSPASHNFVHANTSDMAFVHPIMDWSFGDWFSDAVDAVGKAVRDVVEAVANTVEKVVGEVEHAVEDVVKIGVAVINGVVNFVAKIAGKAYQWLLAAEGVVIHGIVACLKDTLGLDTTSFFALFGFGWDHENIINTQKAGSLCFVSSIAR